MTKTTKGSIKSHRKSLFKFGMNIILIIETQIKLTRGVQIPKYYVLFPETLCGSLSDFFLVFRIALTEC